MLEFLQTGKALSVLAAIGMIGFISKLITRSLYKRLLKETDNMAMTRNRNLKMLKQRLENTCRLGQNIVNTQAYLDKQIDGFSFLHISLDAWNGVSMQMVLLGLLVGAAEAFLVYWYELDSSYIVLYASVAVMSGLFLAFIESCVQIDQKQQRLETALLEYVDNSVFFRAAREKETRVQETTGKEPGPGGRTDTADEASDTVDFEKETSRTAKRLHPVRNRDVRAQNLMRAVRNVSQEETFGGGIADGRRPERQMAPEAGNESSRKGQETPDSLEQNEMEYLKKSLDQIAASREMRTAKNTQNKNAQPEPHDWMKGLSREEAQVLGDIMREYLSGL